MAEDIMSFFGFPFGQRTRRANQKMRGQDLVLNISVSLEDLYTGKEIKHEIERMIICRSCEG